MNLLARGIAVLLTSVATTVAVAAPPAAKPAAKSAAKPAASAARAPAAAAGGLTAASIAAPRQKVSYLVGFDVAQSIAPVAPDMDLAAFERAVRAAFEGKPLLSPGKAPVVGNALMQRIAARRGQAPAGGKLPDVSREDVGYLVGADVGRSLAPIKDELDIPMMIRSIAASFAGAAPLMDEPTRNALREQFSSDIRNRIQAKQAAMATTNKQAGVTFLAANKLKKGVFTTPSGLQYMVLRQGSGPRPRATDRVRVNYHGTLLDGKVFDSSYDRGQPADFVLNQVIPGWTEGVSMMPVGSKYRFWIPSELGYGERGAGQEIGPNSTLVFDVELLSIAQ